MRVLMFGDLAPTGFGTVTNDRGKELLKLGIDLRFISQNDTGEDLPEPFRSRTLNFTTLLPQFDDSGKFLGSLIATLIDGLVEGKTDGQLLNGQPWGDWSPERIILLGDYRAALEIVQRSPQSFSSRPTYHYCPVEGVGLPPRWNELWSLVHPVAMSEFGADEIAKVTGERPPMIY